MNDGRLSYGIDNRIGNEEDNRYSDNSAYYMIGIDLLDEEFCDFTNIKTIFVVFGKKGVDVEQYK